MFIDLYKKVLPYQFNLNVSRRDYRMSFCSDLPVLDMFCDQDQLNLKGGLSVVRGCCFKDQTLDAF